MASAVRVVNERLRRVPVWPFYIVAGLPAVWWFYRALSGALGPEPVRALEHLYGLAALQALILGLSITPLLRLTRINLLRFRRMIGLVAFGYVVLHLAVYAVLDVQLDGAVILKDLTKRPYIVAGALATLLLLPLAITSTDGWVRRLGGAAWCQLHRLVYPAVALAALHYLWLVKTLHVEVLIYAGLVAVLLGYRAWRWLQMRRRATIPAQ